jgi:hypothetical protein
MMIPPMNVLDMPTAHTAGEMREFLHIPKHWDLSSVVRGWVSVGSPDMESRQLSIGELFLLMQESIKQGWHR